MYEDDFRSGGGAFGADVFHSGPSSGIFVKVFPNHSAAPYLKLGLFESYRSVEKKNNSQIKKFVLFYSLFAGFISNSINCVAI